MRKTPPLSAGDRVGRFRLERFLARGSTGQVWLALDEGGMGVVRRVALKLLHPESGILNGRLLEAARRTGELSHPHIVRVLGASEDDPCPLVVLEYVEGETLADFQRSLAFLRLRFPASIVAEVGIAVAEALHHAWTARTHRGRPARVMHGDLGPSNILVADHGIVQVTDFGGRCENEVVFRGTPAYRAPEVWAGGASTPASDLFSLGVILWEMLVGERFLGTSTMETAREVLATRSPAVEAERVAERSAPLAPVLEALLQRDPAARPISALEAGGRLRGARLAIDRPADIVQFVRLVRAGRVDPDERTESLQSMPSLPDLDLEWMSLVRAAGFGPEV